MFLKAHPDTKLLVLDREAHTHRNKRIVYLRTVRGVNPRLRFAYTEYETSSSAATCARALPFEDTMDDLLPRRMATIPVRTISSTP